jgi:hypothetical protein
MDQDDEYGYGVASGVGVAEGSGCGVSVGSAPAAWSERADVVAVEAVAMGRAVEVALLPPTVQPHARTA